MNHNTATQFAPIHGTLMLPVSFEPQEIGQRVAAARTRKGWTQLQFAMEANVSPSTVARWEAGKLPPVRELVRIAEVLGVDVNEFVEPAVNEEAGRLSGIERELGEVRQQLAGLEEMRAMLARIEGRLPEPEDGPQAEPAGSS